MVNRFIQLTIMMIVIVLTTVTSVADNHPIPTTDYVITYQVDAPINSNLDAEVDGYLDAVITELADHDIEPVLQPLPDNHDAHTDANLVLHFDTLSASVTKQNPMRVTIIPNSNPLQPISDILVSNLPWTLPIEDNNPHATTSTVALALYAARYPNDAYAQLQQLPPTSTRAFYLANIAILQNDYDQALDQLDSLNMNLPAATINTAWLHIQLGDNDTAFDLIDNLIPENHTLAQTGLSQLYKQGAQLYALALDYDRAIAYIDTAIAIAQENKFDNATLAELHTKRAEIIFLIYEWNRVEENLNQAIALDDTYAPAYFQRGVLYYTMARRQDALTDFETYLTLAPDGTHIAAAQNYIDSIKIELDALNG